MPAMLLLILLFGSSPALLVLIIFFHQSKTVESSFTIKTKALYKTCFLIALIYGIIIGVGFSFTNGVGNILYCWGYILLAIAILFAAAFLAINTLASRIKYFFYHTLNTQIMEQNQFQSQDTNQQTNETNNWRNNNPESANTANKILLKGLLTAGLILAMLIPVVFVSNLVTEREKRQQEVVKEVTGSWATQQTVSGPFLCIPYTETQKDNKDLVINKNLYVLPEQLNVDGIVKPEVRPRSIYKVLLYRSDIKMNGSFKFNIPANIDVANLKLNEAKICCTLSDLKGIEERVTINFNNNNYQLTQGLPYKETETISAPATVVETEARTNNSSVQKDVVGISAPIVLTIEDLQKTISFSANVKLKGSESLQFIPLSGNSHYNISSSWKDPKFYGNSLPASKDITDSSFKAEWSFNSTNLPFNTHITDFNFNKQGLAFGVCLLQPTDQYSKTMRSIKYAILFIGLTFALFFIIELMQKKPVHPVQYVLIGIALVIFFTLLLSVSEFVLFNYAYLIAASATVLLISLYAKAHFKSIKTASVFALFLSGLYGFIFVLISLEDAALLVGSIGLFIILALVMYGSRKINWYGNNNQ